jgi:hypothetical protein
MTIEQVNAILKAYSHKKRSAKATAKPAKVVKPAKKIVATLKVSLVNRKGAIERIPVENTTKVK